MARRKGPDIASAIAEALGNSDYVSSLLGAAKIADELDGKNIKMKVSIDGAEQVEEITSNIDGLLSSLKELSNYKSRTKFFQSIENATEEVKKSWNDFIKLINSTDIDKSKGLEGLFENDKIKKAALDVYKYSNALTALGGDTSKVSKQISELVEQISHLQNREGKNTYTASAGYLYDVDSFRQVFDLLKKIQSFGTDFIDGDIFEQLGLKVGNFKPVENAIQNILDISLQYDYVQKQAANTASSSYDQQTSSIENTTRAIERLTREQVKLEALSKHKQGRIYDDSEVDYYFDYNISNIQRYSEALDELKRKQQTALNGAVYYQNLFADTNGNDSDYYDEMNQSMQDYAKYTAQVEYIQERLNEAVKNYDPSQITGGDTTEQWIVLITLIKEAAEKIKALNDAIGDVGNDESFKPLLASIEDIKNAFAGVVEEIRNLQSALSNITIEQSTNFNIDNSGKGAKAELQLEEYLNKTVQRYENEYRKFFSDKRLSSDLLFASLASSKTLMQRTGEHNVTQDYFEDLYGQAAITKIQDPKTKIMRIIDFLEAVDVVLKDNVDAIGESWDALKSINKTVRSTRTKGSFTSSLNKKIRDFQKEETEDAKSTIDEALNGDDLIDEQASLAKVASLLEQINNLLNDIADNTITLKVDFEGIEELKENLTSIGELLNKTISNALEKQGNQDIDISKYFNLKNTGKQIKPIGENVGEGIASGIDDSIDEVSGSAKKMADTIIDTTKDILDINSPSEVMRKLGVFSAEGYLLGFTESFDEVKNAIINDIQEMLNNGINGIQEWRNAIFSNNIKDLGLKSLLNSVVDDSLNSVSTNKTTDSIEEETKVIGADLPAAIDKGVDAKRELSNAEKELGNISTDTSETIDEERETIQNLSTVDIGKGTQDWINISNSAQKYGFKLGEIASIQKNFNSKTGETNYVIKDINGQIVQLSENLNLLRSSSIIEVEKSYTNLEKAMRKVNEFKEKEITNNLSPKEANDLVDWENRLLEAKRKVNVLEQKGLVIQEQHRKIAALEIALADQLVEKENERNQKISEQNKKLDERNKKNARDLYDKTIKQENDVYRLTSKINSGKGTQRDQENLVTAVQMLYKYRSDINDIEQKGLLIQEKHDELDRIRIANQKQLKQEESERIQAAQAEADKVFEKNQEQIKKEIELRNKAAEKEAETNRKTLEQAYKDSLANEERIYNLRSKIKSGKGEYIDKEYLTDALKKRYELNGKINELENRGITNQEKQIELDQAILRYQNQLKSEVEERVKLEEKSAKEKSDKAYKHLIDKTAKDAEERFNSDGYNNNNGYKDELRRLLDQVSQIDPTDIDKINTLDDALNKLLKGDIAKSAKEGLVTKLAGIREQISKTLSSNTKMSSDLREEYQKLVNTIDDMTTHKINYTTTDIQKVIQDYKSLNRIMVETGQNGDSMWKRISNRLSDMNSKLIAQYLSWQDLIRYIRTAITTIRELDTALVDLRKTTTMSTDELTEFYYSANDTAQQMGVTTAEIINQASAWSRLGYSSKEAATEMSALSSQFAQISPGMDVDKATDGLVSTMKAFGFEVEDVERNVMDNINRIGNTMATSNDEIVDMLERSSAAMAAANNTIEETIALESAAVQVTRNAETTGTAFRTISMRIRGYDEETEEQLEDYEELKGKIADLTKTTKTPGGISLFSDKDKTTFKSTYQLLKDISEIWDELTDKEQAQLTEKLAGKRGGQVLSSIMNDFSEVERAMTEMSNAAGSSDKEMEIIKDSIDYKLNALKESWVGFLQDALSREDTKELFDALIDGSKSLQESLITITPILTKFVEALSWLIETIAKFNSSTGGLAGLAGLLYGGYKVKSKVNDVRNVMGGLLGSDVENTKNAIEELDDDFDVLDLSVNKTTKSFWASKAALGIYATAIVTTITIAKGIIDTSDRIAENARKAGDSYKDSAKEISDYYERIKSLQSTLHNESASIEEVTQARQDLLEIKRNLIDQYKDEPGVINSVTAAINEESGALDNLKKKLDDKAYRKALNDLESPENESFGDRIFKKLYYMIGGYGNAIDKMEKTMGATYKTIGITDHFPIYKQTKDIAESLGFQVKENDYGDYLSIQGDTADEVLEKLKKLQAAIGNTNEKLSISLAETITDLESEIDKYSDLWNEYILREKILGKDAVKGLADTYNELNKAAEEYNRVATEKGLDSEEAQGAAEEYSEILKSVLANDEVDASTKEFFENMYPELKDVFDNWKFEVEVIPTISDVEKANLRASFAQLVQDGYGDAQTINNLSLEEVGKGTVGAIGLQGLIDVSNSKGLEGDITQLVALAVKEGWISGTPDEAEFRKWAKRKGFEKQIESLSEEKFARALTVPREAVVSWESFERLLEKTDETAKAFSRSEMNDAINELSDGFDKLDEIYADVVDKGSFDFAKLDTKKFQEAFDGLDDEYLNFIEVVSSTPDDIEKCQDAFDNLVTSYIEHSGILKHVTEQNKQLTISRLESMGVANAEEIVTQKLTQDLEGLRAEKEFMSSTSKKLEDATIDEINAFADEKKYSEDTRQALIKLALQKQLVNGTTLDFKADISNIIGFVEILGGAVTALQRLQDIKNGTAVNLADRGWSSSMDQTTLDKRLKVDAQAEVDKVLADFRKANTQVQYKGADKTKDAIDKANKSAEESKEIIDWIEKALQRQEEEIARIDKVVNATYKNWSKRNSSILSEINEINKEIGMQTQAYQAYLRDAEAVPLAENYKKLVREGAMHAETITDKTLKKNIDQYTELYDKAIKAKDAVADLESKIAALAKAKFDNVKSEFEGFTSEIEHFVNMIDKELSHVENMEKIAGKSFYTAKMDQDEQRLEELNKERTALLQALREAEANGIEEGSADWIAMRNDIYSVDEAIADLTYEVEDLKKKLKEVAKLNFDDLKSQFENAISIITGQINLTDSVVSMTQNAGYIASREYYKALIEGSKENVTGLRKEYETLSKTLADAMAAGDIEKYDKQWYEMNSDIMDVKKNLVDAANATIEYANALRQIDWDVFDRGLDRIKLLVDESEFFQELMSWDDKLKDDNGDWTNKGLVKQGLIAQDYQSYMDSANAYGAEAEEIRKLLETDPKNTVLIDRYHELLGLQRESILSALKEKKALTDLIKEGYDELLKRIKKLIDEYNEALDAQKDLMDYSNTINDKTKNIADLSKQLTAYQSMGDTEEGRATVQKLQSQLNEAQKDLEQTEYDKYVEDQKSLLDDFYTALEEYLDGKYQETGVLFEEAIANIDENGKLIDDTLHEEAAAVNYRMTDEFANIWDQYAAEDGIAVGTLNILTLTNEVTTGIRAKMEELPTEARLEEFFNSDDLRLLQELTSVKYNTAGMIDAINSTNSALDQIKSNIVEYSGVLGNKIDYAGSNIASAIGSLEFSSGTGSYDAPSGGGSSSGSGGGNTTTSSKDTTQSNVKHGFKIYDGFGSLVGTADTAQHAAQQANVYINSLKTGKNGMPSDVLEKMKKMKIVPYKRGGLIGKDDNFLDSIARLLGEDHMVAAKEGERILTEDQNKNFEKMVNTNFTPLNDEERNKYTIDKMIEGMAHIQTPNVGNVSNIGNTTTVGDINITLPNVTNKEEFVQWLRTDGQIEKIVQSMTIGRMAGGNSFAKMKY